jgi:hypothetical protein
MAHAEGIMTVKVPFPFIVGHQEFPAGQYDVRTPEDAQEVVSIEGVNRRCRLYPLQASEVPRARQVLRERIARSPLLRCGEMVFSLS